jgi:hypothetical protein
MHFLNKCFNTILGVFYMFRTYYVHLQEEYIIVHAALSSTSFNLLDCLHKRMDNITYKAACTIQSA